jgi:dihydrofolate synthase/folylpolyglutamate synthase
LNHSEAVAYLDAHVGAGIKPGLDRIRLLVESMGSPHLGYPTIHVAGTNGKTSTTRLSSLLLVAHGLSTGSYISPHLERIEERLGVNGRIATPDEFALAVSDVAAFAEILEERGEAQFSYFELTTAMAFAFFVEQAVEAAVVEVGLGGRLDATNVIEADVAVLTGVSLEHTEYLGTTVEAIAAEKLAIAGPDSILVTGPLEPAVAGAAAETARRLGIEHRAYGRDFSVSARRAVGGWAVDIRGAEDEYGEVVLGVHGRHQTVNAAVSVAAVEALLGRGLDVEAVRESGAAFTTPGRMEPVATGPLVMLDGAHNAEGVGVLARGLAEEFSSVRWVLVLGVMGDKDVEAMVAALGDRIESVVTTAAQGERAIPAAELAGRVAAVLSVPVEAGGDPPAALEVARSLAGEEGAVLVTGSLYLVGEVRAAMELPAQ